jgi:hypothetical protein
MSLPSIPCSKLFLTLSSSFCRPHLSVSAGVGLIAACDPAYPVKLEESDNLFAPLRLLCFFAFQFVYNNLFYTTKKTQRN